MTWTPLAQRFDALPFILAGPILRRTEPASVTVWLAVKEPCQVTLHIYRRDTADNLLPQFEGTHNTVRLGDHLHLVAVTARATRTEERLLWGKHYYYDLFFLPTQTNTSLPANIAHLATPGIYHHSSHTHPIQLLTYPGHSLPGFVLPPEDLNQLRIIHGSCRKLHGNGHDMLSAVDALIAKSLHEASDYPHQLFLTGDQIYADDVSPVALFALMDVGQFLFAGNEEEILPLIQVPARALAPGTRSEIVRNKALLTTTHPRNHLLALHEYAAMYLFAWSDVLWPGDLPTTEEVWKAYPNVRPNPSDQKKAEALYQDDGKKLASFRSGLSQVRRALANIPTYMICDDHEVTDDWYLDGKWYQQVPANPLGRRVVRNGLLTYALFQAWGNTPAQFAETQGATLLNTLNTWKGRETPAWTHTIEPILGLPQAPNQSPPAYLALQWHYTYAGPRYQVVVMDTRTQRLYRSPDAFPGLLSPDAMASQLAPATQRNTDVTIIISATPLLGVDLIESIQFWSHWRVSENYAYDREAWSLDWGTFQRLLKTVSDLKRVLFLSGDVHYAFGASLQYWDLHRQMSARIIDYTSSPLCNEGSGAQLAILAIGYPRLQQMLHRDGESGQSFFAWDILAGDRSTLNALLPLIRRRLYLFWWAIPRLLAAHRSPDEIVMPSHGWLKGAFHERPPDRSYHLHYLHNNLIERNPVQRLSLAQQIARGKNVLASLALQALTWLEASLQNIREQLIRQIPQSGGIARPTRSLARRTERAERHVEKRRDRLVGRIFQSVLQQNRWKTGNMIIGSNNLAEIRFDWTPQGQEVMQYLWWYDQGQKERLRMTEYRDTLEPPPLDAAPPLP